VVVSVAVEVLPIHQRLAELWTINKRRPLTPDEMKEVQHCLAENAKYCWKMAYLENMSLMASMTNDVDWQHEICKEIDEFKIKKSAPQRKTDRKKTEQ
jgi:hypothetical protein